MTPTLEWSHVTFKSHAIFSCISQPRLLRQRGPEGPTQAGLQEIEAFACKHYTHRRWKQFTRRGKPASEQQSSAERKRQSQERSFCKSCSVKLYRRRPYPHVNKLNRLLKTWDGTRQKYMLKKDTSVCLQYISLAIPRLSVLSKNNLGSVLK